MSTYAQTFERVVAGEYREASDDERLSAVREVIQIACIAAAAVAIQPIPLVDVVLIAPIQIGLVQAIGRVHGYRLDKKAVLEVLSSFGAGLVTQGVLLATSKLVPFVGWLAAVPMAYALTYSVGEVAHYYFKSGRGVSPDDLQSMFKKLYREKREQKERSQKQNNVLREKLEALVSAREAGLISQAEFEAKKAELLAAL